MNLITNTVRGLLLCFVTLQCGAQQSKLLAIEAEIKDLPDKTPVYLLMYNNVSVDTVAKIASKKEGFYFKCVVDLGPDFYHLKLDTLKKVLPLFLDNSAIKIKGDLKNWPKAVAVSGSKSNADFEAFYERQKPYLDKWWSLNAKAIKASEAKDTVFALKLEKQRDRINDSLQFIWKDYIEHHPNSLYTPFLIYKTSALNNNEKKIAYNKLTQEAKSSKYGLELRRELGL